MAFSTNGTSGGGGRLSSEINVTPLIDVLLVMLIIFMVIVPVMPLGLNSVLPSAAPPRVVDEAVDRPILVEVKQSPTAVRYAIDGVNVEQAEVMPHLRGLLSRRSVPQVFLKADAGLDFGAIAQVINASRAAGAGSVGLITPGPDRQPR